MRIFWSWFRVWVLSGVLALFSTVGDFFVLLSIKELTLVRRVRIRMEAGPALRVVGVISFFHRWWRILGSSILVASRSNGWKPGCFLLLCRYSPNLTWLLPPQTQFPRDLASRYVINPFLHCELHSGSITFKRRGWLRQHQTWINKLSGEVDVWSGVAKHNPNVSPYGFITTRHCCTNFTQVWDVMSCCKSHFLGANQ